MEVFFNDEHSLPFVRPEVPPIAVPAATTRRYDSSFNSTCLPEALFSSKTCGASSLLFRYFPFCFLCVDNSACSAALSS